MSRIRSALAVLLLGALPLVTSAQDVVATIPGLFGDLLVNPVTNKIYVTQPGTRIAVVDGATHVVRDLLLDPGARLSAIDVVANRVYGSRSGALLVVDAEDHITEIPVTGVISGIVPNPATGEVYLITEAGGTRGPVGSTGEVSIVANGIAVAATAFNAVTGRIYVSQAGRSSTAVPGPLWEIDAATGTVVTIPLPDRTSDVAVNPVTNTIYGVAAVNAEIYVIDGATRNVMTLPLDGFRGPQAVLVNPATDKVYVATNSIPPTFAPVPPGHISILDGRTRAVIGGASKIGPTGLALDVAANTVYVSEQPIPVFGGSSLTIIDGATDAVSGASFVAPDGRFAGRYSIAANPVTNRLYVSDASHATLFAFDRPRSATVTWAAGMNPRAIAVNPVTDTAYVANRNGASVTVIRGPSSTLPPGLPDTVPAGSGPWALAVNAATNRIYVANTDSGDVTVIDGTTQATSRIAVGGSVSDIVVNPLTNQVFVASSGALPGGSALAVIDGDTQAISRLVEVGPVPFGHSLALNIATNRVYVATGSPAGIVDMVDGTIASRTSIGMGAPGTPRVLVADPDANRIFVALDEGPLAVVDGDTNATYRIDVGTAEPAGMAFDPRTHRLYLAKADGTVKIVDMDRFTVTSVAGGPDPIAIAVDSVANRIYVANGSANTATVIDGATLATTTVATGALSAGGAVPGDFAQAMAVNPATGNAYVAGYTDNSVTELRASRPGTGRHGVVVDVEGGTVARHGVPTLSASVCCAYAPADPTVRGVRYRQGDTWGAFSEASGNGPFTASLSGVTPGLNFVKLFALDAMAGKSTSSAEGATVMVGAPQVYAFVSVAPTITTRPDLPDAFIGAPYSTAIVAASDAAPLSFAVTAGSLPPGLALSPAGIVSGTPSANGFFTFTVTVTDAAGGTGRRVLGLLVDAFAGPTLANISTRAAIGTGNDLMIGGFVIGGTAGKTVLVSAAGPVLRRAGLAGVLDDPAITLVRSVDQTVVATNDDWVDAANADEIRASGFAPASPLEPAILATLEPGAYTALVTGGTGAGLVAVYEVDHGEVPLINIATRGRVLTGNDVMIAGFVIQGNGPQTVVVTGIGPSLASAGIPNPLANPTLSLVRSSDGAILATNDDWASAPNAASILATGLAPASGAESAIMVTLDPGAYTAILSGAGGGTGVGLIAVYRR